MKAYEYITDSNRWVQNHLAVDKDGKVVSPRHSSVDQVCAVGAIYHCSDNPPEDLTKVREILKKRSKETSIAVFNRTHTHAEVVELLKEANV